MLKLQSQINYDIDQLIELTQVAHALLKPADIALAVGKWHGLRVDVYALESDQAFQQHTQLIAELLRLIQSTSETSGLQHVVPKQKTLLLQALVRDLPVLTEMLGQARGLGAWIAGQRSVSSANRARLNNLRLECQRIVDNTLQPLSSLGLMLMPSCVGDAHAFLQLVQDDLVEAETISIEPELFYEKATKIIDETFELMNILLPRLQESLS